MIYSLKINIYSILFSSLTTPCLLPSYTVSKQGRGTERVRKCYGEGMIGLFVGFRYSVNREFDVCHSIHS